MSLLDLAGKRGLVVGIANASSIAYGCAKAFHAAGAELAITYLNAKAEPYVRPLAEKLASRMIVPCDIREPGLAGGPRISPADSPVSVWVVPTHEELMIARHTLARTRP
jgi:NAD(P)-dependent dehydrogenase (short-subunit alcohol dehydrogenase family)